MSHRISLERAMELRANEERNRELIAQGKPVKSRRQKKYELMRRKQDGILWRIKDRGGFWKDKSKLIPEKQKKIKV